jgi:hypothetical protein
LSSHGGLFGWALVQAPHPARHDRPEVPGADPARWHRQPLPLRADSATTCSATLTAMPLVPTT